MEIREEDGEDVETFCRIAVGAGPAEGADGSGTAGAFPLAAMPLRLTISAFSWCCDCDESARASVPAETLTGRLSEPSYPFFMSTFGRKTWLDGAVVAGERGAGGTASAVWMEVGRERTLVGAGGGGVGTGALGCGCSEGFLGFSVMCAHSVGAVISIKRVRTVVFLLDLQMG